MDIEIKLDSDRRKPGMLIIPGILAVPCLCKADNKAAAKAGNPTRNPLYRNGDTPTGTYIATLDGPWSHTKAMLRSYGPHKVLRLRPIGGDALRCAKSDENPDGRDGLAVHGGAFAADGKSLRPTHGCPRTSNPHQAALVSILEVSGETEHKVEITEGE